MTTAQEYAEKVKAQIDSLAREIDHLSAMAEKLTGDAKLELNRQIAILKKKLAEAQEQLKVLAKAGDEAAGELAKGMDGAMKEMKAAVGRAKEKFQEK